MRRGILEHLAATLVGAAAGVAPCAQAAHPCDGWVHGTFFAEATEATVAACLEAGGDPNGRDPAGWTALHRAAGESDDPRVVGALLAAGAELEARSNPTGPLHRSIGSLTPLIVAVRRSGSSPAVVDALVRAGADVDARDQDGCTVLHHASEAAALILLHAGADPVAPSCRAQTPLHSLAATGPDVLHRLLEAGADVDARDDLAATPLHHVAEKARGAACVELLLAAGADPAARDRRGATPLHYAARDGGQPARVRALVAAGADVQARSDVGETPLHYAAANDRSGAAFATLLALGGDIEARDDRGATLLHAAAGADNPVVVKALLAASADVDARDADGDSPLHDAAALSGWYEDPLVSRAGPHPVYGDTAVVEALLAAGADVGARDDAGYTPLHAAAVSSRNPRVLELLLEAGADPDARTDAGETPLEIAWTRRPVEKRELLSAWREGRAQDGM